MTMNSPKPESYVADEHGYLPEYLSLIYSFVGDGSFNPAHLRPELVASENTKAFGEMPGWLRELCGGDEERVVQELLGIGGHEGAVVRAGYIATANLENWKLAEKAEAAKLNESIDHLVLANQAMFTFMSEAWGITEQDVQDRMLQLFAAEFRRYTQSLGPVLA